MRILFLLFDFAGGVHRAGLTITSRLATPFFVFFFLILIAYSFFFLDTKIKCWTKG